MNHDTPLLPLPPASDNVVRHAVDRWEAQLSSGGVPHHAHHPTPSLQEPPEAAEIAQLRAELAATRLALEETQAARARDQESAQQEQLQVRMEERRNATEVAWQ